MTLYDFAWLCWTLFDSCCNMLQPAWYIMLQHGTTWCRMVQHGASFNSNSDSKEKGKLWFKGKRKTLIQRKKENSDSKEKGNFECGPAQPSLLCKLCRHHCLFSLTSPLAIATEVFENKIDEDQNVLEDLRPMKEYMEVQSICSIAYH